ncbi:hypothetical protein A3D71_02830 [Candidatus Kaiserbacteria bacterium RIFCSPHIGHO2_02_FULL_55_20]|uniref:Uncharacterized protein n=1 Tax=Candidatus Kaiserbacteria bacterium RIFCSPHIGHO2_02_FULL_55_20 TaxID=1798497 RepID=A0A1F6DZ10_9BACT|nr:MAG: hypothetical protein A3D71_02830 [Candidatus Kaiserbacteria bacterium RIFCSPHIGHO2_02_FULL_55_20]
MGIEKGKQSNVLKAGLIAAALATPLYEHGNVEAAEIPQSASWQAGATKYKELVFNEKVEYGGNLVTYKNSSIHWVQPWTSGSWRGVAGKPREKGAEIRKLGNVEEIEAACKFHTHPEGSSRRAFKIPENTELSPFAPPSRGDLSVQNMAAVSDLAHSIGIPIEKTFEAVFDPRGVWYYRHATDEDFQRDTEYWQSRQRLKEMQGDVKQFKREIQDRFQKMSDDAVFKLGRKLPLEIQKQTNMTDKNAITYALSKVLYANTDDLTEEILSGLASGSERDRYKGSLEMIKEVERLDKADAEEEIKFTGQFKAFVTGSTSSDFDFETRYAELQKAYLRGIDAVVRFVPYEKLDKEPPCAGPDYQR